MKTPIVKLAIGALLVGLSALVLAAPAAVGPVEKQPLNIYAIVMFFVFVAVTMGITYWAASKVKTTADFYTAGGGITGFQNGLAIAGDYMSAATLLGLSSLIYFKGYDGFIYMIGFFVGWPVILFLLADRLRNLGKFTFADIAAYRLDQTRIRTFAAVGTLTVVAFYLIVQMVGAGELIQLLFGLGLPLYLCLISLSFSFLYLFFLIFFYFSLSFLLFPFLLFSFFPFLFLSLSTLSFLFSPPPSIFAFLCSPSLLFAPPSRLCSFSLFSIFSYLFLPSFLSAISISSTFTFSTFSSPSLSPSTSSISSISTSSLSILLHHALPFLPHSRQVPLPSSLSCSLSRRSQHTTHLH